MHADQRLWLSKSWTTREPRPSERGDEYHFVDRATFDAAIADHQFLEWAEFHGHLYGTPKLAAPEGGERALLLALIEGHRGVENVEAIAATPGLDG